MKSIQDVRAVYPNLNFPGEGGVNRNSQSVTTGEGRGGREKERLTDIERDTDRGLGG